MHLVNIWQWHFLWNRKLSGRFSSTLLIYVLLFIYSIENLASTYRWWNMCYKCSSSSCCCCALPIITTDTSRNSLYSVSFIPARKSWSKMEKNISKNIARVSRLLIFSRPSFGKFTIASQSNSNSDLKQCSKFQLLRLSRSKTILSLSRAMD